MSNFDEADQLVMINLLISCPTAYTQIKPILKSEYFDKKYQVAISYLNDFSNKYSTLPTIEQLNNESRCNFSNIPLNQDDLGMRQSILDMFETFCKKRALEIAINDCYERLQKGDTSSLDSIIKEAQSVGITKDLGINMWEGVKDYLHKLDKEMGVISTGLKELDKCFDGGLSWGQLNYVVSPSGGGKSLMLANLAVYWAKMGYNVIYLTLELDKELVAKRMNSMFLNIPYREIGRNIDNVAYRVESFAKDNKPGIIQVADMKMGANANDINAYLQAFEISSGIIPEIIIVDYASILSPCDKRVDRNNINLKDKAIAEELREIARERTHNGKRTMVMSANQITKDALSEMEFTLSNIAGGTTLVQTCDNLFSVRTNPAMRQAGEYEIKIMKSRNSGATDKKFKVKYNVDSLLISNLEETTESPIDAIKNNNIGNAINTIKALSGN